MYIYIHVHAMKVKVTVEFPYVVGKYPQQSPVLYMFTLWVGFTVGGLPLPVHNSGGEVHVHLYNYKHKVER